MVVTLFFRDGLKLGVDFVGGLKIIAKFEKGVDEARVRNVLTAFNPMVQQIGESDLNEYVISTKVSEGSTFVVKEKVVDLIDRSYPGADIKNEEMILFSLKEGMDISVPRTSLGGLDAAVQKLKIPGKNAYVIYKKETAGKKKSNFNTDAVEKKLKGQIRDVEILRGLSFMVAFNKMISQEEMEGRLKAYSVRVEKAENFPTPVYIVYRVMADESDTIRDILAKSFKKTEILSVESVGPAVGDYLRGLAVKLIAVSILLMTIYLAYRFEFRYSVGAMVAVLHDVALSVAFCGVAGIEINIPVVAALLTIFGYSVNDTIVIFDRIRENTQIESKSTMVETVNKSITFTFSRTILTSFLTLLTVFALFLLGGEGIDDFAAVLLFGMIVGIYSTVYIASPVVLSWEKLMQRIKSSRPSTT